MALKDIDPSEIDWNAYKRVGQNSSANDSYTKKAGEFALGLATRGAQGIAQNVQAIPNALNSVSNASIESANQLRKYAGLPEEKKIENLPQLSEGIEKYVTNKFGEKSIEPENPLSKAFQLSAANLPFLFLGGIPTAAKVGADISGSLFRTAAGDNAITGIIADVLGQKGFKSAAKWWKGAAKEPGKISKHLSNLYQQRDLVGDKIPVKSDSIYKKLNEINEKVNKEYVNKSKFDEAARNRVISNLQNAEKSITKPNLTATDLAKEEQLLNKAWASKNSVENDYYNDIRKAFSSELKDIADPKFTQLYDTSKELYKIDKWQSGLGRWVTDKSSRGKLGKIITNPIAQASLALISGIGTASTHGTPTGIATAAATKILPAVGKAGVQASDLIRKASKFLFALGKSDDGRRLLMDIVADAAKENTTALTKDIHALNKKAEDYDKKSLNLKNINPNEIDWSKFQRV